MIITRTPFRVSLIGGGTDIPAFYEKHLGAVVSFTINKYVYVSVNRRFENGFRVSYSQVEDVESRDEIQNDLVRRALGMTKIRGNIEITSVADIPGKGSGLGSSSSFTVGLLNALLEEPNEGDPRAVLAERAFMVESEGGNKVGKQDQYAAAYGGVNYMTFGKRNVCVRQLNISQEWKQDFERHSLLLWTGMTRNANGILSQQHINTTEGRSVEAMMEMRELAQLFYERMLYGASIKGLGDIINQGWKLKRKIASEISTPQIDEWYHTIMECGAWGVKLCGAGGGGFLLVLAPVNIQRDILAATKLRNVPYEIEMEGSKIIYGN